MHDHRHSGREDDLAREQRAVTWKARLQVRLVHLRMTRPGRLLEKLVWLIVG